MRLLIVSDVHGHAEKVRALSDIGERELDALIICGDLTHFGNLTDASRVLNAFTSTANVLFVPGNCDPRQLASEPALGGATNLHGKCLNLQRINFVGIGGSIPTPFRTPFEATEEEMEDLLNAAGKECRPSMSMMLVSHDPPYGTKADRVVLGHHVGSKAVRRFIENSRPSLVACGHIHESRGIDSIGTTIVVNPGPLHRDYYAIADIGETVTVTLAAL